MTSNTRGRGWAALVLLGAGCGWRAPPTETEVRAVRATTSTANSATANSAPTASAGARRRPDSLATAASAASAAPAAASAAAAVPPGLLKGESVKEIWWLPTDGRLAIATERGVRLLDPKTWQKIDLLATGELTHTSLSIGGDLIAFTTSTTLSVHRTSDGSLVRQLPVSSGDSSSTPGLSRDGQRVALADTRLKVWSLVDGTTTTDLENPQSGTWQVVFHDDGERLVLASFADVVVVDLKKGAPVGDSHSTETGGTFTTVASPDGRWVVAASAAGHSLQVWRTHPWQTGRTLAQVESCKNHISADFSPDGRRLHATSLGAWQRDYEVGSWRLVSSPASPFVVDDQEGVGHVRDSRTRQQVAMLERKVEGPLSLSNDGLWVVETRSNEIVLRSTRTGKIVREP